MKVAVLMSGQARYLEQSADWWTKRTFQPAFERLHADYYFNIWDDGTDNLDDRIISYLNFRPKHLHKIDKNSPSWPSPRSWDVANNLLEAGLDVDPAIGKVARLNLEVSARYIKLFQI